MPRSANHAFSAFGVPVAVRIPAEHPTAMRDVLPPGASLLSKAPPSAPRFEIEELRTGGYRVSKDGEELSTTDRLDLAIDVLDARVRLHIAENAPDRIFVHAGVVAVDGRAIVLPGWSFAGKSTLTAALVRRGATYYSDEYAPLDERGMVHPYPRRISLRREGGRDGSDEVAADEIGGVTGSAPAPVGLVVATTYEPGATFAPADRSAGAGALLLLTHTVPARERPQEALEHVTRAAQGAIVLEGPRGDAGATAEALIARLRA